MRRYRHQRRCDRRLRDSARCTRRSSAGDNSNLFILGNDGDDDGDEGAGCRQCFQS